MDQKRVKTNESDKKKCKALTWNMRGARHDGQSTYEQVRDFILNGYQIIALQEAGPDHHPAQANMTEITSRINITNPDNVSFSVQAHRWNIGTTNRPNNVYQYFLNTDPTGNRVNLSIVSVVEADEVIILNASGSKRPIFGIRIGDVYFFNIHANAGTNEATAGSNSAALVNRVHSFMAQRDSENWVLMGDFNRNPETLQQNLRRDHTKISNDIRTLHQTAETHSSGGNLDYAVVQNNLTNQRSEVQRLSEAHYVRSDHRPLQFLLPFSLTSSNDSRSQRQNDESEGQERRNTSSGTNASTSSNTSNTSNAPTVNIDAGGLLTDMMTTMMGFPNVGRTCSTSGRCPLCGGYHGSGFGGGFGGSNMKGDGGCSIQ